MPGCFVHLCTVKTVIWQICSNRPGKKVPQSARLFECGGGGGNCYLGNAQIEVTLLKIFRTLKYQYFGWFEEPIIKIDG